MKSEDSSIFHENSKTSDDKTSNPKSEETFSIFGDGSCGEPLFTQHVSLDFTPNKKIDSDYVQRKVVSFWKFIENTPEIHNLMVKSERNDVPQTPTTIASLPQSETESIEVKDKGRTAVSMLEFIAEKDLIGRMFEGRTLVHSQCTFGFQEYEQGKPIKKQERKKGKKKEKKKSVSSDTSTDVCSDQASLCNESACVLSKSLHEWDLKHLKSMDPPGHPPSLQHAILQRRTLS